MRRPLSGGLPGGAAPGRDGARARRRVSALAAGARREPADRGPRRRGAAAPAAIGPSARAAVGGACGRRRAGDGGRRRPGRRGRRTSGRGRRRLRCTATSSLQSRKPWTAPGRWPPARACWSSAVSRGPSASWARPSGVASTWPATSRLATTTRLWPPTSTASPSGCAAVGRLDRAHDREGLRADAAAAAVAVSAGRAADERPRRAGGALCGVAARANPWRRGFSPASAQESAPRRESA